ncbi:MAG: CheR family methyltransferase [Acidobacteriota bacterium]
MIDDDCVRFLQWALPRLRMRWAGFRKVRAQVCKRIARRLRDLGLPDAGAYRALLESRPGEWAALDALCRVTISRFYRDRDLFDRLRDEVLPELARRARARGSRAVRCWSAGCASGEEAYTLALIGRLAPRSARPRAPLVILATDVDQRMLERARAASYSAASLRDLPAGWRVRGFVPRGAGLMVRPEIARAVELRRHDVRGSCPQGRFDLILCRNLVFTYYEEALQREIAGRLAGGRHPGGALVLGERERLPRGVTGLAPWPSCPAIHRRAAEGRGADPGPPEEDAEP